MSFTHNYADSPVQYWAFLANPSIYDVERAVQELQADDWLTDGKPLKPGDRAIVWKAKGRDEQRGIVALAEVLSEPFIASNTANPYWRQVTELAGPRERVRIRYLRYPEFPLWLNPNTDFLNDLSVARARGGTVFYVTPEQWKAVSDRLTEIPEVAEVEEPIDAVVRPTTHNGQAFLADAVARRAIEIRAMELARAFYSKHWDEVFDVSANASCDLHCRSANGELRVEVKGTTGQAVHVLLTRNEVMLAQAFHPHTALYVVSQIQLDRSVIPPVAQGGVAREIRPWTPIAEHLTPIAYRYDLPAT